jgi:hypothetical protein
MHVLGELYPKWSAPRAGRHVCAGTSGHKSIFAISPDRINTEKLKYVARNEKEPSVRFRTKLASQWLVPTFATSGPFKKSLSLNPRAFQDPTTNSKETNRISSSQGFSQKAPRVTFASTFLLETPCLVRSVLTV